MTKIIGLTGGIGSGKTTVANFFKEKGVPVYIADDEARLLMENKDLIKEIQLLFNENVIKEDGKLNRQKISQIVFKDPIKLKELNAIVHPKVKAHFEHWLKEHSDYPFIIKEVAILFETKGHLLCDATILVTAPIETRIQRVMLRDNKSKEEVLQVLKNQLKDEDKIPLATYVIVNENLAKMHKEAENILLKLKNL